MISEVGVIRKEPRAWSWRSRRTRYLYNHSHCETRARPRSLFPFCVGPLLARGAFFLGGNCGRQTDLALLPRFLTRLSLRATSKTQETRRSIYHFDVVTGRKDFRF